jgi:Tol biopolymer transport system component
MSWSPDSKWIAAPELDPQGGTSLFLIPVGAGTKRQLTSNSTGIDATPAFSPDGRYLAYASCLKVTPCDIYMLPLGPDYLPEGKARRVTDQNVLMRGLAWMPDGCHLVYSAGIDGLRTYLWRVSIFPPGPSERIADTGFNARHPAVSRSGDRLAFSEQNRDVDIWKYADGKIEPFLASTAYEWDPSFSPDGKKVAFCSSRSGEMEIWVCDRDGGKLVQLTDRLGRGQYSPAWSPDGKRVAFASRGKDGKSGIYVVDGAGGQPRRLTPPQYDALAPTWSRDGKWIYFARSDLARIDIWRMPDGGGECTEITDHGGYHAVESPDGKEIYYTREANTTPGYIEPLYAKPLAGGPERVVLDPIWWYGFDVVEDGIYYTRNTSPGVTLAFFDFRTRQSRDLAQSPEPSFQWLTVSPDRKTVLFGVLKHGDWNLMMIENFR